MSRLFRIVASAAVLAVVVGLLVMFGLRGNFTLEQRIDAIQRAGFTLTNGDAVARCLEMDDRAEYEGPRKAVDATVWVFMALSREAGFASDYPHFAEAFSMSIEGGENPNYFAGYLDAISTASKGRIVFENVVDTVFAGSSAPRLSFAFRGQAHEFLADPDAPSADVSTLLEIARIVRNDSGGLSVATLDTGGEVMVFVVADSAQFNELRKLVGERLDVM